MNLNKILEKINILNTHHNFGQKSKLSQKIKLEPKLELLAKNQNSSKK